MTARGAAVGARVVLRYLRPPGSVPSQSDALGTLVALAPLVRVRTADGTEVAVEPERVVVLKTVPPKPVRTTAIRSLERAIALAGPGDAQWMAGWVARAGCGGPDALRAEAAVPLADATMPEGDYFHDLLGEPTLRALHEWYSARGLPLTLRLPDRLVRPPAAWEGYGEHLVLAAALPLDDGGAGTDAGGADSTVAAEGDGDAARVSEDGAVTARLSEAPDGRVWAVLTRGAEVLTRGAAGGSAGDIAGGDPGGGPAADPGGDPGGDRGASPGGDSGASPGGDPARAAAVQGLCRWAAGRGAAGAVLAVPTDAAAPAVLGEAAARALGFADHHRCRFVRLTAAGDQTVSVA